MRKCVRLLEQYFFYWFSIINILCVFFSHFKILNMADRAVSSIHSQFIILRDIFMNTDDDRLRDQNISLKPAMIIGFLSNYSWRSFVYHVIIQIAYYCYIIVINYYLFSNNRRLDIIIYFNALYISFSIIMAILTFNSYKPVQKLFDIIIRKPLWIISYYPIQIILLIVKLLEFYNFNALTLGIRYILRMLFGENMLFKKWWEQPLIVHLLHIEDYINNITVYEYPDLLYVHFNEYLRPHWSLTGQPTKKQKIEDILTKIMNDGEKRISELCHILMVRIKEIAGELIEIFCKGGTAAVFRTNIPSEEWPYTDYDTEIYVKGQLTDIQIIAIRKAFETFIYQIYRVLPSTLVHDGVIYTLCNNIIGGKRIRRVQHLLNGATVVRYGKRMKLNIYSNEFLSVPNDMPKWTWNCFNLLRVKAIYFNPDGMKFHPEILDISINTPFSCKYIETDQLQAMKQEYHNENGILYPTIRKSMNEILRMLNGTRKLVQEKIDKYIRRLTILSRYL